MSRLGFVVNDGARFPFAAWSLDAVLLFAVLTCIPDDDAQKICCRIQTHSCVPAVYC